MVKISTPPLKRAIKAAQEMNLEVSGFEVLADGGIRVLTAPPMQDSGDTALDAWMRSQRG